MMNSDSTTILDPILVHWRRVRCHGSHLLWEAGSVFGGAFSKMMTGEVISMQADSAPMNGEHLRTEQHKSRTGALGNATHKSNSHHAITPHHS